MSHLSIDVEQRYIIQWFNEWSELQRDDFLPIFAEYLMNGTNNIYLNGVVAGVSNTSCNDKPMSLFQCRIKLFREWSQKWPEEIKSKLKEKIIEVDPNFGEKLQAELSNVKTNGTVSLSEDNEWNEQNGLIETL